MTDLLLCEGDRIARTGSLPGVLTRLQFYGSPLDPHVAVWVRHDNGMPGIWTGYRWREGRVKAIRPRDELRMVAPVAMGEGCMPSWGDMHSEKLALQVERERAA